MAKLNAAHMSILCIFLGASYFACDCTAREKPQDGTRRDEEAAGCSEAQMSEADSDQGEADAVSDTAVGGTEEPEEDARSTVKFKDTDNEGSTPTSEASGTEELEENEQSTDKFKDTDDEVPTTVQPAVHDDSARDAVPALKETENLYRHALRLVATRAYVNDDAGAEAIELVRSLVRLIFAVKAIRTYIENVRAAWTHLKDTVHHLAEHEEHQPEERESGGDALLPF